MSEGTVRETLLRSWGKKLAKGKTPVIPIFLGNSWTVSVSRGNKRALRVVVPIKNATKKA